MKKETNWKWKAFQQKEEMRKKLQALRDLVNLSEEERSPKPIDKKEK